MASPHREHMAKYRRNLLKLYNAASEADVTEGLAWYPTATEGCKVWANQFNVDPRTVACVIAAISPQCDWTANLRIAFEILSGQTLVTGGALRANVAKARAILADNAVSLDWYFKKGPKVKAFSQNLMGNKVTVTIDTHAVQAAMNDPLYRKSFSPAVYGVFAEVYQQVANRYTLHRPADFQAIIWCAWKRRHSTARKQQLARELNA